MKLSQLGAAALAALVLMCAGTLAGCGGGRDPRLEALQSDPMASVVVPHIVLESTYEAKANNRLNLAAQYSRTFTYTDADPAALVDQAAALAKRAGWQQTSRAKTVYIATRRIGNVSARLAISAADSKLLILLEGWDHDHAPFKVD